MVSIERNLDWRSNQSIYEATLRENPKSSRVHFNLAVTYQDLLDNEDGAKRHYTQVITLYKEKKARDPARESEFWDEEIQSHFSLGQIFLERKQYNDAARHFGILSTISPVDSNRDIVALSLYGLGQCFRYSGDPNQAQQLFKRAIEIQPSLAPQIQAQL
jgi:tetratricopeptide (TPR) repeat protein